MTDQPAGLPSPRRGAIAAPRSALAAAAPYAALVGAPPNFITIPQRISMWGNDVHGDCVTAEEAFAKACNNPEIFITDDEVITWAKRHGVLEGAYLTDVMGWMQNDGFADGASIYDDGPYLSVNWMNSPVLQNAIFTGPVKIGVAADQRPPGARQAAAPGGSARDFISSLPHTKITVFRCAAMDPCPGWHSSLAYRSPGESTGTRRDMRCSRGIPSGSSTCLR